MTKNTLQYHAGRALLSVAKTRLCLIYLALLLLLPATSGADAPEGYPFLRFDQAMALSQREAKPLFVYFGRYGCGYCEKTNREAFIDPSVRERYTANYALAYVDAESGRRIRLHSGERITERELGTRYRALVTPVFTFLTPNGDPIYRMIGVQRIEDLIEADEKIQATLSKAAQ
ncbi:MAG: thioredoxin [gamma proteobacterium symbiont of Ctena orbiculata]|uniref:Thioredoxin family protein n=1 Tax=Candidatus Thiodiazotropha taylori TaxID=2792791 RepID=A0A944MGX6_9GAMM|nr:thioredoxin family protein [Candidatus Thiodiazotropha taylori]PUB81288.1 MAG: thioredoxin [gamma proteobacterium symbiont of Ctena orbiculata]MBT3029463.1 thioredoxin family protein [Candidatus Thiodiazotropha taylori]MBT3037290.1 thioredoxin family protein [Candidatus Thiodiazotropha taylori]MBV2139267.1 thioredoxin family protein [Candidatus Thiodiazotropha taylori]